MAKKEPPKTRHGLHRLDAAEAARIRRQADGWMNTLTGLGAKGKDKRLNSIIVADRLEYEDAYELYRSNDMAARIVDLPVDEMTRQWVDILIDGESEQGDDISESLETLGTEQAFNTGLKWSRAYGGAGIVMGVMDGLNPKEPINEATIESIDFLTPMDMRELWPIEWYADPYAPKYGQVARYRIVPQWVVPQGTISGLSAPATVSSDKPLTKALKSPGRSGIAALDALPIIHESRVIRFDGILVNRRQRHERLGWGDSVLNRANEVLRDFGITWASVSVLLQDFARAVYKMKGLAEIVSANGSDVIAARIAAMELARGVLGATLLDSEDEFTREPTPFSGVPELLDKIALRLAATAPMPVSLLMGQSPAGLNATGDSDIRYWYDKIKSDQKKKIVPGVKQLSRLVMLSKKGPTNGALPDTWKIQPRPLWQLSDLEESTRRLNMAQADVAYVTAGVLTAEEVAVSRFGGDGYSVETQLLVEDPDDRALQAQEQAETEAELNKPDPLDPNAPPPPKKGVK